MRTIVVLLSLLAPMLAIAGIDKPWQEEDLGGGSLPGASMLFGAVGAGYFIIQGLKDNDSAGNILLAAVLGFSFGSIIGLPVSCMLR